MTTPEPEQRDDGYVLIEWDRQQFWASPEDIERGRQMNEWIREQLRKMVEEDHARMRPDEGE